MKPIDIKRSTVPLWKNLELVVNIISEQETDFQRDPMYLSLFSKWSNIFPFECACLHDIGHGNFTDLYTGQKKMLR